MEKLPLTGWETMARNVAFDDLALAVGHTLAAWSFVENALSTLFAQMSVMDKDDAYILMASVTAFDARLKIITNMMVRKLESGDNDLEVWTRLKTKLSSLYHTRHKVAHFSFVVQSHHEQQTRLRLVPFFSNGNFLLNKSQDGLSVAEIEQMESDFWQAGWAVNWFICLFTGRSTGEACSVDTDLILELRSRKSR